MNKQYFYLKNEPVALVKDDEKWNLSYEKMNFECLILKFEFDGVELGSVVESCTWQFEKVQPCISLLRNML